MWSPLKIPYYRSPDELKCPLPTEDEIRSSTDILGRRSTQTVVKVGEHYLVKYGAGTSYVEGQTLAFIECHLNISAPKLHAMYWKGDELFLVMGFMPGETLQVLWPTLSAQTKTSIMKKLRIQLDSMRQLSPETPGFLGSVNGGSIPHHLFWTRENAPSISGPFTDEQELNTALVQQLRRARALNEQHSFKADFVAKHIPSVLCGHKSVFTHSDIQRKNLIVSIQNGQYEVSIVDWEDAGWYPSYWEYFAAFSAFFWNDDWSNAIRAAIDPWPTEAMFLKFIHQELFF